MPWFHIDDLCEMYLSAVQNTELKGTFNAVAPEHITNKAFTKQMAKIMKRPFWPIGVPSFILKIVLGKMSTIVLDGTRVSSDKISGTDFKFSFETVQSALTDLLKK